MNAGSALLIVSAFFHALWNAQVKKINDKHTGVFIVLVIAFFTSVLIAPFTGGFELGSDLALQYALVAGLFEAGYVMSLAATLDKAPLGISYAIMRGGAMIIVWIISSLFLEEQATTKAIICVAVVFIGLFVIQPRKSETPMSKKGLLWALSAAACIAGYTIFYRAAVKLGSSQVTVFAVSMLISIPTLGFKNNFFAIKNFKNVWCKQPFLTTTAGMLSAVSFIIFLYGLSHAQAGAAVTLRNTSVLFAQFFAIAMGEKISLHQWLGIIMITTGAILLA